MDVYADLLFLVNFSMDFLCLYLSIKLLHLPRVRWRMLSAAALGGVYSVVALLLSVESWLSLALILASALACARYVQLVRGCGLAGCCFYAARILAFPHSWAVV